MQVLSGLKSWPLLLWTALFALFGALTLYDDAQGRGLNQTMYYREVGVAIYPIYYGLLALLLTNYVSMLWHRNDYLRVDEHSLAVGRKVIPLTDVKEVVLRTNFLGLSRVAVVREEGKDVEVMGYFLSQPTGPTIARLRAALPLNRCT
jgi:hypothetical protein